MNAMMSFMFWKVRRKFLKSEIKSIQQDWNVILQRPEYVACSKTIKSATEHQSKGDWINFVPCFACFRNCWTFFWLFAGRMRNLTEETLSLHNYAEESFRRLASPDIDAYCCVEEVFALDQHNFFESDQHNFFSWMQQGRSKTIR